MATAAEHKAEIDRINGELSDQASLISQIQTALEGKAAGSGGASVETCTVNITSFTSSDVSDALQYLVYSAYENGQAIAKGYIVGESNSNITISTDMTLENVVCGSAIFLNNGYYMNGTTVGGGVEEVIPLYSNGGVFKAPTTAGAIGTIDIYDAD